MSLPPRRYERSRVLQPWPTGPILYSKCSNCGDTVEGRLSNKKPVFPVDERGWCTMCRWGEPVVLPDEERRGVPKRRKRRAVDDAMDELTILGEDF